MRAFYNEIDTYCCDWLSNLMDAGMITPGEICDKSIEDVFPDELRGYDRCHFFAGIGTWDYALNLAGWGERPVWTGSAPCQPFSAAGKGLGFADERHLWPLWHWLIAQHRPAVIFGEQVASKDVEPWIDLVFTDLEATGYACGADPFPSAGVGAPHIRDRTFFVAYAERGPTKRQRLDVGSAPRGMRSSSWQQRVRVDAWHGSDAGRLADASGERFPRLDALLQPGRQDETGIEVAGRREVGGLADTSDIGLDGRRSGEACNGRDAARLESERLRDAGELADTASAGRGERSADSLRSGERSDSQGLEQRTGDVRFLGRDEPAGPTNGFWRAADWLLCRDSKWRPVEPGTFPLVDGAPSRVGRLRAYGNTINPWQAAEFILAAEEARLTA